MIKKITTIIGARPQFIKAGAVSPELRKRFSEKIIHTGQHFDKNMSDVFFSEMSIPRPDYNLGIAGKSHGAMTGEMLIEIEKILMSDRPDMVVVYGDTNSTLAGALAAVKLHIPVCHIEAGFRSHSLLSPEEVNRLCADHISSLWICSTLSGVSNLKEEGISANVFFCGDPMYDAFIHYSQITSHSKLSYYNFDGTPFAIPDRYYLLTCHREENTQTDEVLTNILRAANSMDAACIFPVHPRNKARVERITANEIMPNIAFIQPVGYLESIHLEKSAVRIITDSGGVQREAFFAGVPCVTILDNGWNETFAGNANQLTRPYTNEILEKLHTEVHWDENYMPFGDGHCAEKIAEHITAFGG